MPAGSVRIGGAHVTFNARVGRYLARLTQVQSANRAVGRSFNRLGAAAALSNRSMTASVAGFAGLVVAIEGVRVALTHVTQAFLAYDHGLIRIAKTTGIVGDNLGYVGRRLQELVTVGENGRRPLPGSIQEALDIAGFVGQLGIGNPNDVVRLTRSALALSSSTNIVGEHAAQTLGQLKQILELDVDEIDSLASAIVHLGNNTANTEDQIADFATQIAQNTIAVGKLRPETILALSSAFAEVRERPESASTVVGRTLDVINRVGSGEFVGQFREMLHIAGRTAEETDRILANLTLNVPGARDDAIVGVLDALSNLPLIAGEGELAVRDFLEALFADSQTNVRIRRALGSLSERPERLSFFFRASEEAFRDANRHFEESGKFAESYTNRIRAVGNALDRQAITIGAKTIPSLTGLLEHYRAIEVVLGTILSIVAFRGGSRLFSAALGRVNEPVAAIRNRQLASIREQRILTAGTLTAQRAALARFQREQRADEGFLAQKGPPGSRAYQRASRRRATNIRLPEEHRTRIGLATLGVQQSTERLRMLRQEAIKARGPIAQLGRVARVTGAGLLSLFGGWVGAIVAATTALALFFSLYESEAEKARRRIQDVIDLQNAVLDESGKQPASGSQFALAFIEGEEKIAEITQQRFDLYARIGSIRRDLSGPFAALGGGRSARSDIARIQKEIDALTEQLDDLLANQPKLEERLKQEERSILTNDRSFGTIENRFTEISLAITRSLEAYNEFKRAVEDGISDRARELDIERQTIGLPQYRADYVARINELRSDQENTVRDLNRELAQLVSDYNQARDILARANDVVDATPELGSPERKAAAEQRAAALSQAENIAENIRITAESIVALNNLEIDTAPVLANAVQAAENRRAAALIDTPRYEGGNIFQVQQQVRNTHLQRQIDLQVQARETQQALILSEIDLASERAGQAAVFQFRNDVFAEEQRVLHEVRLAEERLADASAELTRVTNELKDAEVDEIDALIERRSFAADRHQEAQQEVDEKQAIYEALQLLITTYPELERVIRLTAEGAEVVRQQTEDQVKLAATLSELATSGVNNIENALVELATTGKGTFSDFASAIIADMIRIIARATITAQFLRALGVSSTGDLVEGGILDSIGKGIQGLFAGGSPTSPDAPFIGPYLHDGGVVGYGGVAKRVRDGLKSNEVLAVLERGEEVLTRTDPRHRRFLPKFHDGGVIGQMANAGGFGAVTVRIENNGSPAEVSRANQSFDGRGAIIDVVLDSVRNGRVGEAISQRAYRR